MRKISDVEWTDISPDERRLIDIVDYLCGNDGAGMQYDEAIHWLMMLPPVLAACLKDDTFRQHLEDENTGGDMMLQRFPENACTGYPDPPQHSWFYRLVRFDQRVRHWVEGLFALDPYDGKTGLRLEDEDEWRDLYS